MAAPLVQRVTLDAASAQAQLAQLERQLATLNNPINVPVDIDVDGTQRAEKQMEGLRREVDQTGDEFTTMGRKADDSTDAVLRVGTRGASAFTSLKGSIIGVGAAIAAIQGVRLLGGFAADAIQSASNLEESLSKTNVVFRQLSGGIQRFAADAPKALGLSTAAALEATSTFGNLFVALGLSREAAADLSPSIVQLAADLASFNNIAVDEAVEKLRSGLVGEVEPLRALGVNLTAATVDAKAFALGFVDANGAITEAGKVQARYALILEQTTTAQGDYARTSTGVANTQRTLAAEWENAKTTLGEALLPAYQQLLGILPGLITQVKNLAPQFAAVGVAVASAAEGSAGFLTSLLGVGRVLPSVLSQLSALATSSPFSTFVEGAAGVFSGDLTAGVDEISESFTELKGVLDSIAVQRLQSGFIADLQAGVDPAVALTNALLDLTTVVSDPQELQTAAEAFARISGLDASRLKDVTAKIRETRVEAGIATGDVLSLIAAVNQVNLIEIKPQRRGSGAQEVEINRKITESALERAAAQTAAAREEAAAARLFEETIGDEAGALELLGQAADSQNTSIIELLANTAALTPIQQAAAAALSSTTLAYLGNVDAINELKTQIGILPGALDAAQSAMKTAEGDIVEDFDTFIANLQESLAAAEAFDFNIQLLRVMGFGALADALQAGGPELAKVAQEAVEDPIKAGIANADLSGTAKDSGEALMDKILEGIEGKPITQGLIDSLIAASTAAETPEVADAYRLAAEFLSDQMNIIPVIQSPVLAANFALPPGILELISPAAPTQRGDAGRSGLSTVNVEQNFFTEPAPSTTTQRAAQEINSIVANTRS